LQFQINIPDQNWRIWGTRRLVGLPERGLSEELPVEEQIRMHAGPWWTDEESGLSR